MTPKRRAPRARRTRTTPGSDRASPSDAATFWEEKYAESIRANGVVLEELRANSRVVLEALQDCVKKSEFNERFESVEHRLGGVETELVGVRKGLRIVEQRLGGVEQRLDGVEQRLDGVEHEVRALRLESIGYARAEDVRELERRVSALERSSA